MQMILCGQCLAPASGGGCAAATSFLARTSGLDATHVTAYTSLICGLVSDGVWAKLDALYILATQDSTTAKLNLVQNLYNLTAVSAPTFTVDRGYTGGGTGSGKYLDTGFEPDIVTANYTLNSAHISVWDRTSRGSAVEVQMASEGGGDSTNIATQIGGNALMRINDNPAGSSYANADAQGWFLANRTGASAETGYKNAVSIGTDTTTAGLPNANIILLANSGPAFETTDQLSMASIGASLSGAQITAFYSRLQTYMTAVGA